MAGRVADGGSTADRHDTGWGENTTSQRGRTEIKSGIIRCIAIKIRTNLNAAEIIIVGGPSMAEANVDIAAAASAAEVTRFAESTSPKQNGMVVIAVVAWTIAAASPTITTAAMIAIATVTALAWASVEAAIAVVDRAEHAQAKTRSQRWNDRIDYHCRPKERSQKPVRAPSIRANTATE